MRRGTRWEPSSRRLEEFEGFELAHVSTGGVVAVFVYDTCEITGDHGCPPPLQIQIFPLCFHLYVATPDDRWKRRGFRGAPVGLSTLPH